MSSLIPRFDSGVSAYLRGTFEVEAFFPVDLKGNSYVCCELCRFYRPTSRRCALNDAVCEFPGRYIGGQCPLTFEEETNGENDNMG